MTILGPPRHPLIDNALSDAQRLCAGRIIDDRPALTHAARVAVMIGNHHPLAPPEVIAAALLHDAPEFAPPDVDLDQFLTARYGAEVTRLVRGMQAEHDALDRETPYIPDSGDELLVLLSTSDKAVALTSLLRRARLSGDVTEFFAGRRPLLSLLDHFRACQLAAAGVVPGSLTVTLGSILDDLDISTAPVRGR
jgi:hypothetical protein